jgi:F-type H+-transporting ATPase subunit delta
VAAGFGEKETEDFFSSPVIGQPVKVELIKKALGQGLQPATVNLVVLLAENGRLSLLSELVQSYQALIDLDAGITRGIVRAAKALSAETQHDLEEKITQTLKKKIVLTFKEDASILGGVVAEVGGWTFDDSIETHLRRMNEDLLKN